MKPHIKDKLWTQLSELPTRDVGNAAADRIRARSLAALAGPPSRAVAWSRRMERFWTDFLELPMIGVVMAACLSWAVQGMAGMPIEDDRHTTSGIAPPHRPGALPCRSPTTCSALGDHRRQSGGQQGCPEAASTCSKRRARRALLLRHFVVAQGASCGAAGGQPCCPLRSVRQFGLVLIPC